MKRTSKMRAPMVLKIITMLSVAELMVPADFSSSPLGPDEGRSRFGC